MNKVQKALLERFYRYSSIPSESKAGKDLVPSSEGQRELALLLKKELEEMKLEDIYLSRESVLTAKLRGNKPNAPAIGWIAHLDTADIALSPSVNSVLVENYNGEDVVQKNGKRILVTEHPELLKHRGKSILFSDGNSVLGADNKAAISIIMECLSTLSQDASIPHGDIYIAFVPDEEVGLKGSKAMDLSRFPVDWAYTIDCCEKGEIVWETFNAGEARIEIEGISAHPMSSKGKLVNPVLLASDFISLFSPLETPENTEGTEGFIWVKEISGNSGKCTLRLMIRDHSKEKYEEKKRTIERNASFISQKEPRAKISLEFKDTYSNIKDAVNDNNKKCITLLRKALKDNNIEEKQIAMRGGTDGSFLSSKGILTPNYFTGALNFHSTSEFWPLEDGEASYKVTLSLMKGE